MKKLIYILSGLVFVVLSAAYFGRHEIDLAAAAPKFDGYEVHRHVGEGKLTIARIAGVPLTFPALRIGRPEEISGRKVPELDVLAYYEANASKDKAANATLCAYLMEHQGLIPSVLKSREDTILRGRPATQTRFFYFWGTIYKKVPTKEGQKPSYAVLRLSWDHYDGRGWETELVELEETRYYGRGVARNVFWENDYPVLLN